MPLLIVPLCKVSAVASDWDGWISGVCSLALHRLYLSSARRRNSELWHIRLKAVAILIITHTEKWKGVQRRKINCSISLLKWAVFAVSEWLYLLLWWKMLYFFTIIIDYFTVSQLHWLIRWIEALVNSTVLTSNPLPLIKGNRVSLINSY